MGDIAIGFCLDQSGSMETQIKEAVSGFNAFKEEQVAQPGFAYLTLVLFDTTEVVRFTGGDLKLVPDLGQGVNPYTPSGGTALYDAVDTTITQMENWLSGLTMDAQPFDGQVLVAIFTDGGENSSKRVTIDQLNQRISDKKEDGWQFIFMGSGGASWTEGHLMAAAGVSTLNYAGTPQATEQAYAVFSGSVTQARASGQSVSTVFTNNVAGLQADPTLTQSDDDDD